MMEIDCWGVGGGGGRGGKLATNLIRSNIGLCDGVPVFRFGRIESPVLSILTKELPSIFD